MEESLRATTFKDSTRSFLKTLDQHGIEYSRHLMLSEMPMASGLTIEIIISGGWGVLAVACLAWAHARKSRKISITSKDNKPIWLEGYSAEEAAKILQSAKGLTAIDTTPDESE